MRSWLLLGPLSFGSLIHLLARAQPADSLQLPTLAEGGRSRRGGWCPWLLSCLTQCLQTPAQAMLLPRLQSLAQRKPPPYLSLLTLAQKGLALILSLQRLAHRGLLYQSLPLLCLQNQGSRAQRGLHHLGGFPAAAWIPCQSPPAQHLTP